MQIKGTVVQDREEVWFQGTREERSQRILTCLDIDSETPMPNTFDYRLRAEEAKAHGKGSLTGKVVTLLVSDIKPAKGGRLVMSGKLSPISGKAAA